MMDMPKKQEKRTVVVHVALGDIVFVDRGHGEQRSNDTVRLS